MNPIISVAGEGLGEMCFPAGLNFPFILPFGKVRIYGDLCRYAYHFNKTLQGFVQRKLDKFEIKLTLFVIICNCGTCNCHFPFVWCFNRYEYKLNACRISSKLLLQLHIPEVVQLLDWSADIT